MKKINEKKTGIGMVAFEKQNLWTLLSLLIMWNYN